MEQPRHFSPAKRQISKSDSSKIGSERHRNKKASILGNAEATERLEKLNR